MEPAIDRSGVESQIRTEFEEAFQALDQAPEEDKLRAESRLNRAVRRLYDLIGYGKMPPTGRPLRAGERPSPMVLPAGGAAGKSQAATIAARQP